MARIPTLQRRQGLDTAAGTVPNMRQSGAVGAALADAGGELAAIGERLAIRERQRNEFLAQQGLLQLGTGYEADRAEVARGMDPTGKGFHDTAIGAFDKRASEYLEKLPPDLREKYAVRVQTLRSDVSVKEAQAELAQWDSYQTVETDKMLDQLATGITQYGEGSLDNYLQEGENIIRATSLPETVKAGLVDKWKEKAQVSALLSMPPEQRKRALGEALGVNESEQGGVSTFVNRIINAESNGNARAKNPDSSATGAGQFIDSTWLSMIRKYRPELTQGKSNSQILQMRYDKALSTEMTLRYAEENAATLKAAGFAPSAGNIYLAHFLGPAGAVAMLRADPNADAAAINPQAANSNKSVFYKRGNPKSVAQVIAWAGRKMGGEGNAPAAQRQLSDPDPRFANIPLSTRLQMLEQADNEISTATREAAAQQTKLLADLKGTFQLGIALRDPTVTREAILQSPLADDDKAALINTYNTKHGDSLLAADAMRRIDGGGRFNPYDSDDRKAVNLAYTDATGGASIYDEGPAQAVLGHVYGKSGVLPQAALNDIRAGLVSGDAAKTATAAMVANQLASINRGGVEAAENGAALLKAATTYRHLTGTLGLSHDDAGKRMVDMADPEKQRQREALLKSDHVQKRVKKIDVAEVRDIYDPGLFGFDPDLGPNEAARATMLADYKDMFEESVVESAGDLELAKELATQRFQRLYAPSALTLEGGGVITRLPPERTYPAGPDGTHDYIGQQVEEALKAEGVEADRVFLKYYNQTEIDYEAGRPARYEVWYEQGGQLKLYNLPFYADPEAAEQQWLDEHRERHQGRRDMLTSSEQVEEAQPETMERARDDFEMIRDMSRSRVVISPDGSKRVISE